jgi:hypothetical protein
VDYVNLPTSPSSIWRRWTGSRTTVSPRLATCVVVSYEVAVNYPGSTFFRTEGGRDSRSIFDDVQLALDV